MSRIGSDAQVSLRPCAMQVPGTRHRANNIVPPLHDHTGNVSNLAGVFNQIIVGGKETVVHEVMAFNARKGEGELGIGELLDRFVIKEKLRRASFPDAPRAGSLDSHSLIIAR